MVRPLTSSATIVHPHGGILTAQGVMGHTCPEFFNATVSWGRKASSVAGLAGWTDLTIKVNVFNIHLVWICPSQWLLSRSAPAERERIRPGQLFYSTDSPPSQSSGVLLTLGWLCIRLFCTKRGLNLRLRVQNRDARLADRSGFYPGVKTFDRAANCHGSAGFDRLLKSLRVFPVPERYPMQAIDWLSKKMDARQVVPAPYFLNELLD